MMDAEFPHANPTKVRVLYAREYQSDEDVRAEHGFAPGVPTIIFRAKDCRRHPNRAKNARYEPEPD